MQRFSDNGYTFDQREGRKKIANGEQFCTYSMLRGQLKGMVCGSKGGLVGDDKYTWRCNFCKEKATKSLWLDVIDEMTAEEIYELFGHIKNAAN